MVGGFEKQSLFRGVSKDGTINVLPLLFGPMEKTAAVNDFRSKLHPRVQDFANAVRPTPHGIYVLVNALGAGEYWGSNANGDLFPEAALIHSPPDWDKMPIARQREIAKTWSHGYPTFLNAYPYQHHVNKNPEKAFGRVELVTWNPEMHRVELVVYLDRALSKKFNSYDIIERIENGEFPDVSMGCKVPADYCTICNHASKTRKDYCEHASMMMNKIMPDGRKVAVRNDEPRFFDISFVFIGADRTAKVMHHFKEASLEKTAQVERKLTGVVTKISPNGLRYCVHYYSDGSVSDPMQKVAVALLGKPTAPPRHLIPEELKAGQHEEQEHTSSPDLARMIALDHLAENAHYYAKLHRAGLMNPSVHQAASAEINKEAVDWRGMLNQGRKAVRGAGLGLQMGAAALPAVPMHGVPSRIAQQMKHVAEGTAISQTRRRLTSQALQSRIQHPTTPVMGGIQKAAGYNRWCPVCGEEAVGTERSPFPSAHDWCAEGHRWKRSEALLSPPDQEKQASEKAFLALAGGLTGATVGAGWAAHKLSDGKRHSAKDARRVLGPSVGAGAVLGALGTAGLVHGFSKLANGDMLQYFLDHPEKAEARKKRGKPPIPSVTTGTIKEANDPIKKKLEFQDIPIWIEWPKGSTRQYKDKKTGEVKYRRLMEADYGYIPGTKDADGEELDVYVGPMKETKKAYVIRQLLKKDGSFDEHKLMIGYGSKAAAEASYEYHMGGTKERLGGITEIPISSVKALFADNAEKTANEALWLQGMGTTEIASPKTASHRKISEIIKDVPAGPFSKETLPKLEQAERDIPNDILDRMGGMGLSEALSTPAMMGIVLKPREFQRIMLVRIGEKPLADELDRKGEVFSHTDEVDSSIPVGGDFVSDILKKLLAPLIGARSAAGPAIKKRVVRVIIQASPEKTAQTKTASGPLFQKIAAAYNGYRSSLLKKANEVRNTLLVDPQLSSAIGGEGMAQAFAGGINKAASDVFCPETYAYLMGAYRNREAQISDEERASLAQMGAFSEATA